MDISLCMITHNDFDGFIGAVKSCEGLIKEVIVIDQSTNQEDKDKIKSNSNFYLESRVKGYADPDRHFCYSLCSFPWILALDTDEYLSDGLKEFLSKLNSDEELKKLYNDIDVFWFNFRNIITHNEKLYNLHDVLGDDPHPRLFKKGSVVWPERAHTFPQFNTDRICYMKHEIIHDREWSKVKESHDMRKKIMDQENINLESNFINQVEFLLRSNEVK